MAVLLTASPQQCSEKVINPMSDAVSWFLYCVADVYKCSLSKKNRDMYKNESFDMFVLNFIFISCIVL